METYGQMKKVIGPFPTPQHPLCWSRQEPQEVKAAKLKDPELSQLVLANIFP